MEDRQVAVARVVTRKTWKRAAGRRAAKWLRTAAPVVAVLGTTCAQDVAEPDSGVVSVNVADAEEWVLDGAPLFVLGDDEADPLSGVVQGLLVDSGRVVVGDGGNYRVLVVDAEGRTERVVGGKGEGPLEFTAVTKVAPWPGDSVFVYDRQADRYSVFSVATGEGRSTMLRGDVLPVVALPAGDGELWMVGGLLIAPGQYDAGRRRVPLDLFRYVTPDSVLKVATLAGPELFFGPGGRGYAFPPVPAAAGTSLSAGDDRLYVSDGERPVVTVMDRNGATVREIEVVGMDVEVTDDLRSMITDSLLEARSEERMRSRLEKAPVPSRLSGFGWTGLAQDGTLWLAGRVAPGIEMGWWVNVSVDGRLLRRIELPRPISILDASGDRILVRSRDALGVQRVALHTVARR